MAAFNNNKRAVESILVATANTALVNAVGSGGSLPGGGTRASATANLPLMSAVNAGRVNLAAGQLGIFATGITGVRGNNNAILSTDTYGQAPQIQIAVGTSTSQTPGRGSYPLVNNEPYVASGTIDGRYPIILSGRVAEAPTFSMWRIGGNISTAGQINLLDNTEYTIRVAYHGQILDVENSRHAYSSNSYSFVTPSYSTTVTNDLDHFVMNMVYRINAHSRMFSGASLNWGGNEPVIALAMGTVANGAQNVSALTVGASINVFVDRLGNQRTITLTAEMLANLNAVIPAGYGVVNTNLAIAGTQADAEWILLVAMDRELAYDDRVKNVKIRLDVGLPRGFGELVTKTEVSTAYEGEGLGRHWVINYTNTAGQRKYAQFQRQEWPFIEVPSGINPSEYYNVYVLEHLSVAEIGVATTSASPKKTIVLIPTCNTTARDSFETYINQWVKSTPHYTLAGNVNTTTNAIDVPNFGLTNYC